MNSRHAPAFAGLLIAVLCWSGNALVARAFYDQIPPLSLSFWRWVLATTLLLPAFKQKAGDKGCQSTKNDGRSTRRGKQAPMVLPAAVALVAGPRVSESEQRSPGGARTGLAFRKASMFPE